MEQRDILDRTFGFALGIVKLCKDCERSAVSRALIGQLLRAATSVGANVEEAQAGQSRADFLSKMSIACKESREANYWLRLLTRPISLHHRTNFLTSPRNSSPS